MLNQDAFAMRARDRPLNSPHPCPPAYNAGMGTFAEAEIDAMAAQGGLVVTASDRAARACASAFHRARRAEGLTAWPAPNILDWKSFVRAAWEERSKNGGGDGRLLLNPTQEQALWAEIAGATTTSPLCSKARATAWPHWPWKPTSYSAPMRPIPARFAYAGAMRRSRLADRTCAAFSGWLHGLRLKVLPQPAKAAQRPRRLPLELIRAAGKSQPAKPRARRCSWPVLTAFCPPSAASSTPGASGGRPLPSEPAAQIHFHQAPDAQAELAACALWCSRQAGRQSKCPPPGHHAGRR